MIKSTNDHGSKVLGCFLDVSKAFDMGYEEEEEDKRLSWRTLDHNMFFLLPANECANLVRRGCRCFRFNRRTEDLYFFFAHFLMSNNVPAEGQPACSHTLYQNMHHL